jgi:hypothetical protein
MNPHTRLFWAGSLTLALSSAAQAQSEPALQAIHELGAINGQALACDELSTAQRAKRLMLAHAPKTQRFGAAFEESTQKSFLAQTSGKAACPDAAALSAQLDALAPKLQAALPAAAAK